MSETTSERLYNLLPTIYRQRDVAQGEPLRVLMAIIESELQTIEADIDGLYDNWFIETCEKWVVPYIADLLGMRGLSDEKYIVTGQRARVANAIRYRRRKGIIAVLERVVRDATGWYGRAVEFFELLGATQNLQHLRPDKGRTLDLRDLQAIEALDGPFESLAHTVDVRSKHNIPNIGLFLWRLQSYRVTRSPAYQIQTGCYTFHPLGYDMSLFNQPQTETGIFRATEAIHLPVRIRQSALADDLEAYHERHENTPADHRPLNSRYYGRERSISVFRDGDAVPPMEVVSQDLQEWTRPPQGVVTVDVSLGRLAFAENETPNQLEVSYNYGFSADIGGGPYDRHQTLARFGDEVQWMAVSKSGSTSTLQAALNQWNEASNPQGVIQIDDNAVYGGALPTIQLDQGSQLVIQAADGVRPNIRPIGSLKIDAPADGNASLTLNGLLIQGKIVVEGNLTLTMTHCTLMPRPQTASTTLEVTTAVSNLAVTISQSIVGPIRLPADCLGITIEDSIVDASLNGTALAADDDGNYGPRTTLKRTTVFGQMFVKELPLASDAIFTEPVHAQRRQIGCVRYSFVPNGSRTPRRFRCQPDLELETQQQNNPDFTPQEQIEVLKLLVPLFTSTQYGDPSYGQLHVNCPQQIRTGAEDDSEMGVFSLLKQTYREANLRPVLEEYLPLGLSAEIFYVT
ncbi:MAG: phage tail protein [Candidatus Poribacteria bacterium]|nr:phage tail protein [Candidatus Poribacteria bacterium]